MIFEITSLELSSALILFLKRCFQSAKFAILDPIFQEISPRGGPFFLNKSTFLQSRLHTSYEYQ